ncbi:hypothetical protein P4O66_020649 [Electrophorus voltai]|uniref:BHLH domain-containing protein n=1 Tax=Electrophorus voltai TaxID=2609070 RepID=A0AAD8ZSZ1_9TELE|nr:hypothetical protein P4O66_020649 [Electrophorus voltai]
MDTSSSALLLQDFKPEEELELAPLSVDAGYFSASGSPSPSPSLEMSCISPPFGWWGHEPSHGPAAGAEPPALSRRRTGSKNPRKKRQTASEREKLRMRDLTKALHHLRTYLPASVAPTGQTLTKIETLRLAIRYISYLSSQLDVPEQPLGRRTEIQSPADLTGLSHYSMAPDSWRCSAFPETPYPAHGAQGHHGVLAVPPRPAGTDLEQVLLQPPTSGVPSVPLHGALVPGVPEELAQAGSAWSICAHLLPGQCGASDARGQTGPHHALPDLHHAHSISPADGNTLTLSHTPQGCLGHTDLWGSRPWGRFLVPGLDVPGLTQRGEQVLAYVLQGFVVVV